MNNINVFKTVDLSLAVYLIAKGAKYIGVEIITKRAYRFLFEDSDLCYKLENEYLQTKEKILLDAKRNIKHAH